MYNLKKNEGITLIALVITVIVLIILAGVAINMLSGNNGILNQAASAKTQTEQQGTLEQLRLAVMASIGTDGKINTEILKTELNKIDRVNIADETIELPVSIEIDETRYAIDEDGDVYIETWYYTEEKKITNGTTTIELGDTINYDATKVGTGENQQTLSDDEYYYESLSTKNGNSDQTYKVSASSGLTWKVLGVEKGQILIMPTTNLKTGGKNNDGDFYLGTYSTTDFTNSQNAYVNAVDELNKISEVYGHGEGADGARSVKVEDLDNITRFDKTKYRAGQINGYGNEVTYSKGEDGYVYYDWSEATEHPTKNDYDYKYFTYYTGSEWKTLGKGESVTLKSTSYTYTGISCADTKVNDNAYDLIFEGTESPNYQYYWMGSSYVYTGLGSANFGMRRVYNSSVDYCSLFYSDGGVGSIGYGVRPAVYLESDINLMVNGANSWNIS